MTKLKPAEYYHSECSNCGFKATGRNLYAELQGKVKVPK